MPDINACKAQFEARLKELNLRLHHIEDELDNEHSRNWDEAAVEREDDEVLQEMGREGLQEIRAIKAALARIEEGTFGTCAHCGEEISAQRLDVIPYAALCQRCAR